MSLTYVMLRPDVSRCFRTHACSLAIPAFISVRWGVEFSGNLDTLYFFITDFFCYINLYSKSDCAVRFDPVGQYTDLQRFPLTAIVFIFIDLNSITSGLSALWVLLLVMILKISKNLTFFYFVYIITYNA
jgi:hypothetical protein